MARAASITVDNRSSTLTAFALDFSSQNLLADDGAVTFTGAYQSSGGYPPLNETVSYLVALGGSPPGSPNFGSVMLTIEGITDASQDNTQVDMIFNTVVTGPISPNYFVPDPGPDFYVAAFLRQQDAAYVPTDLSVVILSSAVPEPHRSFWAASPFWLSSPSASAVALLADPSWPQTYPCSSPPPRFPSPRR